MSSVNVQTLPAKVRWSPAVVEIGGDEPPVLEAQPAGASKAAPLAALFVLALLAGTLFWHVATDLLAPTSSTGSVTAPTTLVAARVAGQVDEVYVADNQYVREGDPLFSLDPAPFDLAVRQAEANLVQAEQAADVSVVSLASVEAKVNQAQALLDGTEAATTRTQALFDRGLVPQAQVDSANAQLASVRATLEAAEADLESARLKAGGSASTNPQVQAAQVQLEQAQLNWAVRNRPRAQRRGSSPTSS